MNIAAQAQRRENFRYLCLRLAKAAAECGMPLVPYFDPDLIYFSRCSPEDQERSAQRLSTLATHCEAIYKSPRTFTAPATELEQYLNLNGLTTDPALFPLIAENEAVDIYDGTHHFCFASLNILQHLTYSIEDLYCRPWYELFHRDTPGVQEKLVKLCLELAAGQHVKMVSGSYIENNVSYETHSVGRMCSAFIPRYFASVFRDGKPSGYVCVNLFVTIPQETYRK